MASNRNAPGLIRSSLYIFLAYFSYASLLDAQSLHQKLPVSLDNVKNYEAVASGRVLFDAIQRTGLQRYPAGIYVYEHDTGHVSIGDHDRVSIAIYTAEDKWVETRLGTRSIEKAELERARPLIKSAIQGYPGYRLREPDLEYGFRKIINPEGYWYEVYVIKEDTEEFSTLMVSQQGKVINP